MSVKRGTVPRSKVESLGTILTELFLERGTVPRFTDSGRRYSMGDTNIFKVLSDEQRREILVMLKNGRMNAGDIAKRLDITPAALSYHLKLLKNADLVLEYKEKNFIYYEINTSVFEELILWIGQFGGGAK